jgi:hypothetical protein
LEHEVVERIASEIRSHYSRLRCRAQGINSFSPGEKWDKYFTVAAKTCIENRIPPREFVEAQFNALKPWPQITALGTAAALERFGKTRERTAIEVAQSVSLQLGAYESLCKVGKDPKKILIDEHQGFDPLFIYVTAVLQGYDDLLEAVFPQAAAQYLTSSHYDAIYGDAIPDQLRELT